MWNIRRMCYYICMKKTTLSFLIFGDIFGKLGRSIIKEHCAPLQKKYKPDFTMANAENITHGSGVSVTTINDMMDAGIEFFTGGNHSLDNKKGNAVYAIPNIPLLRPENIGSTKIGTGHKLIQIGSHNILIINLLGQLFMKSSYANPFTTLDGILKQFKDIPLSACIVDFHAETTAEKAALAHYADGRVSLVFGTHTHVPTADARIMPHGTGFITDIGFNGPLNSIIGIQPENAIYNFTHTTKRKTSIVESGTGYLNALFVTIDTTTAQCTHIEHISRILT